MRGCGPGRRVSGRWQVRAVRAALALTAVALAAGCGPKNSGTSGAGSPTQAGTPNPGVSCGTAKTAANVPVQVFLSHGSAPCKTVLSVQKDYAKAILDGSAPGNGGGGPVKIDGWTCQGFATPVVLRTGQASKCVRGSAEILAILPSPA
jgi:hypothetical protein